MAEAANEWDGMVDEWWSSVESRLALSTASAYPVARTWSRIRTAPERAPGSARLLAEYCGALTVRHAALVAFANLLHATPAIVQRAADRKVLASLAHSLHALRHPTGDGAWRELVARVHELFSQPDALRLPSIPPLGGNPAVKRLRAALDGYLPLRNRYHHESPLSGYGSRLQLQEFLAATEELLASSLFVTTLPLVEVVRHEEPANLLVVRTWMGHEPPSSTAVLQVARSAAASASPGRLHVESNGRLLELWPLAVRWPHSGSARETDGEEILLLGSLGKDVASAQYSATRSLGEEQRSQLPCDDAAVQDAVTRRVLGVGLALDDRGIRTGELGSWIALKLVTEEASGGARLALRSHHPGLTYRAPSDLEKELHAFVASPDERLLAFVGDSGTGKSALLEHLGRIVDAEPDLAALHFDGSRKDLPVDLTEHVLALARDDDPRREAYAASLVQGIPPTGGRALLVFIDAVNENPLGARAVLRRVQEALTTASLRRLPRWVKFVVTSRVAAWSSALRDPELRSLAAAARRSPQAPPDGSPAILLRGFESEDDRRAAYGLHREAFELLTDYEDLSPAVRELVGDPLSLWLLARACARGRVPQWPRTVRIRDKFEDLLQERGEIRKEDRTFLAGIAGRFAASIEAGNRIAVPHDAGSDESFDRLAKAGILEANRDPDGEVRLGFRFESFYDHHLGLWLHARCREATDRSLADRAAIPLRWAHLAALGGRDFAWGPLVGGLEREIDSALAGEGDVIESLARCGDPWVREALVAALVRRSDAGLRSEISDLLVGLVDRAARPVPLPKADRAGAVPTPAARAAGLAALVGEAADRALLAQPLVRLLVHDDEEIRLKTLGHAGAAFARELDADRSRPHGARGQAAAFLGSLLDGLLERMQAARSPARKLLILRSLLEMSCLVLMDNVHVDEVRDVVWTRWRDKVLLAHAFSRRSEPRWQRTRKGLVRRLSRRLLLPILVRRARHASPLVVTNFHEFQAFFPKSRVAPLRPDQREIVRSLTGYLRRGGEGAFFDRSSGRTEVAAGAREVMEAATALGSGLVSALWEHVVSVHGAAEPEATRAWLSAFMARIPERPTDAFPAPSMARFDVMQGMYMAFEGHLQVAEQAGREDVGALVRPEWLESLGTACTRILELDEGRYRTRVGERLFQAGGPAPPRAGVVDSLKRACRSDEPEGSAPPRGLAAWAATATRRSDYVYNSIPMHWHAALHARKHGEARVDLFAQALEDAIACGSLARLRSLACSVGAMRANMPTHRGLLVPLAEAWHLLTDERKVLPREWKCSCKVLDADPRRAFTRSCDLRHLLVANLGQLWSRHEADVRWFLDEVRADAALRRAVEAAARPPELGDVFARADFAAMNAIRMDSAVRQWLVEGYEAALCSTSVAGWLGRSVDIAVLLVKEDIARSEARP